MKSLQARARLTCWHVTEVRRTFNKRGSKAFLSTALALTAPPSSEPAQRHRRWEDQRRRVDTDGARGSTAVAQRGVDEELYEPKPPRGRAAIPPPARSPMVPFRQCAGVFPPSYGARAGRVITLEERMNGCLMRSECESRSSGIGGHEGHGGALGVHERSPRTGRRPRRRQD